MKWGWERWEDEKGSSEGGQLFHGLLVRLESEQRRVIRSQEEEGERADGERWYRELGKKRPPRRASASDISAATKN